MCNCLLFILSRSPRVYRPPRSSFFQINNPFSSHSVILMVVNVLQTLSCSRISFHEMKQVGIRGHSYTKYLRCESTVDTQRHNDDACFIAFSFPNNS